VLKQHMQSVRAPVTARGPVADHILGTSVAKITEVLVACHRNLRISAIKTYFTQA